MRGKADSDSRKDPYSLKWTSTTGSVHEVGKSIREGIVLIISIAEANWYE